MNKKILGLDLGVTSIGWAVVQENETRKEILGMGSRIVPLDNDEKTEFSTGNKISKNQKRTAKRTQRKGYDRYQLRRSFLTKVLVENEMFDESLFKLQSIDLWGLRAKGVTEKLSLKEIGRVLYHLNQKRGYKSSRSDANLDKKDTEYVLAVKGRHQEIKELGLTIGQKFYEELQQNEFYRIKEQVFPREAYLEEFDAIVKFQSSCYPDILTEQFINRIRNEIIYYQRPLKSQKGLVSICELAGFSTKDGKGNNIFVGPKVAPKSSPIFQLCKIWEIVNNISLKVKSQESRGNKWIDFVPTIEQKAKIAESLSYNSKMSYAELLKLLGLSKENVYANKQIQNGLPGNITISEIKKILENEVPDFNIEIEVVNNRRAIVDKKTGEVLNEEAGLEVSKNFEKELVYQIWHTIYSIKDEVECQLALVQKFGISEQKAKALAKIDFTKHGFGNKSSKAIRKILPYLMRGYVYSDACELAGYNHSNSLTKEEKAKMEYAEKLELIPKNSLRQPVVEKILNQAINVVNAIISKYGKPDEIRVELARELKQSKDERNEMDFRNRSNEKLNAEIGQRLSSLGIPVTKRYIQKYKFIFPSLSKNLKDAHVENTCIYCGKSFNISEALTGDNFDIDHIVPKSLLFDDSQTNKVLVHRSCNAQKTNQTAFDFIAKKGELELIDFINRVDDWFKRGIISYSKMQRLKISYEGYLERKRQKKETESDKKLWENFIDRQLRETQYISRKARSIFEKICPLVTTSEGTVTAELRRLWGWNEVLMNLQKPKYRALGLTQAKEWTSDHGQRKHSNEEIVGWTKRDDHRHHAIDALVVACTKQGYIQRINTLNSSDVKDAMRREILDASIVFDEKRNLLEQYFIKERPFTTSEVENETAKILVSFKSGKKVASKGIRKTKINGEKQIVQRNIIVPRGALSEESVYGKIKIIEKAKPIKYLFEHPDLIVNPAIKNLVKERLNQNARNVKLALASIKKNELLIKSGVKVLEGDCFKEEYVIKYPIQNIKSKDVQFIVDSAARTAIEKQLLKYGGKEKEAFKETVWLNEEKRIPIKSVRMFTGLSVVEPLSKDNRGKAIGFVKPGNNHHIGIYIDENGNKVEHICTFWHAVERKKYGLPVVIKDTNEVWSKILEGNDCPDSFLEKLPKDNWIYHESLQQNEYFLLGIDESVLSDLENIDYRFLSDYLFRVQKIGASYYVFRHHLETSLVDTNEAKLSKRYISIRSFAAYDSYRPIKIWVDVIGKIKKIHA